MNRKDAQRVLLKNCKAINSLASDVKRLEKLRSDLILFLRGVSYSDFTVCKLITTEIEYIKSKIDFLVQSQKQVKKFLSLCSKEKVNE